MSNVVSAEIASKPSIAAIGGGPWCKMQLLNAFPKEGVKADATKGSRVRSDGLHCSIRSAIEFRLGPRLVL